MRWSLILLAGCGAKIMDPNAQPVDANDRTRDDANPLDGETPDAYVLGMWGTPQPLTIANSNVDEDDGTMSWDGNELIFARKDAAQKHLYITRKDGNGGWSTPTKAPFSSADPDVRDESPRYTADNLTLYFASTRTPTLGQSDIWMVTRNAASDPWPATPTHVTAYSSDVVDKWFAPCGTEYLMIHVNEIYGGALGAAPAKIGELDSAAGETGTFLTQDCLTAYFASTRDNNLNDLWMAHRTSVGLPWQAPSKVTDFGTANAEQDPWMSADGRTFIFASDANGTSIDLFISTR